MNHATRSIAVAGFCILAVSGAASSCGPSSKKPSTSSTGNMNPGPANPAATLCKVGTSYPKAGKPAKGLVGGKVEIKCNNTPDELMFWGWLYYNATPSDPNAEYMADDCTQSEAPATCTLASSCKPGLWSIQWSVDVYWNGSDASDEDVDTYHTTVTAADCRNTA